MDPKAPSSPLQKLAGKWRMIGLVVVAFMQMLRRYEDGRKAGARAHAEQMLVIICSAQIMLMQDMSGAQGKPAPETEADRQALEYLRLVSVCLLAMARVTRDIIARGLAAAPGWMLAREVFVARPGLGLPMPRSEAIQILDPG